MLRPAATPLPERPQEPAGPEGWLRSGYQCEAQGDTAAAENWYRRVLEADPAQADALYFLGRIAAWDHRQEEAIALFQKAVDARPRDAVLLRALGTALNTARRFDASVDVFRECLALQPDCTELRNSYAVSLIEFDLREEARVELERIREQQPDAPYVDFNLGGIYREYGRADEAIAAYRRALKLLPDDGPTYDNLLLTLHYSAKQDAAAIFAEHRRYGEHFARSFPPPPRDPAAGRRLRIGYVSPDFRNHVVSFFIWPVLSHHDRARFEITCYHVHPEKDRFTEALRTLVEHWHDCENLSDAELAERIRTDRIDILVDLAGHTVGNRLLAFALKPAPVQATYLGYPNTTGLGAIDYRITDAYADPPGESDLQNVEKLVRLAAPFLCFKPPIDTPGVGHLPAATKGMVTFGCFNHSAKISAAFLDAAARILNAVPGSRFVLKGRPYAIPDVAGPIRDRFARAGVGADRVELRGWEPSSKEHLEVYGAIDIALDSFPYNGTTTTCEALWMGVPVVTYTGDRHAARVGSSLVSAVGLGDCVARDVDGYVDIAVRMAGDLARLAELRSGLRERMRGSPLMNEVGFTRGLEAAYLKMWEGRLQSVREPAADREALTLLWNRAFEAGNPGAAIDPLLRAIEADARVAAFHYMLGCALQAQGKTHEAIAAFCEALALEPGQAKYHNNLGVSLELSGNLAGAAARFSEATRLDPGLAQAFYNLGNVAKQQGDAQQAIRLIAQAIAAAPGQADWHCNLGTLQYDQLQLDEAIASFRNALAIDPKHPRANTSLGGALLLAGHVDEAGEALRKALEIDPALPDTESWLLLQLHYRQAEDAQALFERHRAWARRHTLRLMRSGADFRAGSAARRRLNVGYVSPDFMDHPVSRFIEPVLAAHDRGEVDVFCYANSGRADAVTRRLRERCENWRDIFGIADEAVADRMRADGIDILVDLAGHTGGGRLLLFAGKPAPVQVTWLGYPNTTGLAEMDYRFTDAVADPVGDTERFHTEKLVRLPRGFLCYAPPADSPEVGEAPQIAAGHVTFACFNNLAKVTPRMVELWAELLRALPAARMILKAYGLAAESARRELRERFLRHGVAAERLDLCPPEDSPARHMARYREVDIALDVFPYNGATTTCEALWMGVPVVTLAGKTHVSRVGASLLSSAGLSGYVASTPGQYIEIATRLAVDGAERRVLRHGMRERLRSSPLLDAAGFARALEAAYKTMWAEAAVRAGASGIKA